MSNTQPRLKKPLLIKKACSDNSHSKRQNDQKPTPEPTFLSNHNFCRIQLEDLHFMLLVLQYFLKIYHTNNYWACGAVGITLDSRRYDQGSIPGRADKYDIHFISEYMIKSP